MPHRPRHHYVRLRLPRTTDCYHEQNNHGNGNERRQNIHIVYSGEMKHFPCLLVWVRRIIPAAIHSMASKTGRSAVDLIASSRKVRKRVESIFGWMKTVGGFRRSRYRGVERTGFCGELVATAYNLVRRPRRLSSDSA